MEFFLDKDNYCCVKNTANPDEQVIGDFFEGDIQGGDYYVNFIIDIINQIKNDEIENWQGTGNAHTISITKDKINIFNEFTEMDVTIYDFEYFLSLLYQWRKLIESRKEVST
jgi:hypothetical protein